MAVGKVVWFNEEKGYGFIEDKKGKKYFAHFSDISSDGAFKKLNVDQVVNFDIEPLNPDNPSVQSAKNIEIQS